VFVDGAGLQDLDVEVLDAISREHAGGQSPEKFLQYMDLAEYGSDGLRLRRAALLLFAKDIARWHPRCEVRVVRVSGLALGVGKDYNVSPRDDQTVRGNILHILQTAWDTLRPYLTQTKLVESGIFRENLVYPEEACREGLINAVAHRDYSIEGKGIEILIFDDRLEVKSPGGLLSSICIDDLRTGKRTHQSRNAYLARVLREFGYMREMGEGMLRIFRTMRDRDLVPPELQADAGKFDIVLHHRSVFSPKDQEWLAAYSQYGLSRDEQRTILLGRDGHHLSMNEITKALGIVDTDEFRKLIEHLRRKGILYNTVRKIAAGSRRRREVGKFAIRPPDQTEQYRQELLGALQKLGPRPVLSVNDLAAVKSQLSTNSPFVEAPHESLKLLGFADERLRPLPSVAVLWKDFVTPVSNSGEKAIDSGPARNAAPGPQSPSMPPTQSRFLGTVARLKTQEGYGFLADARGSDYFFHITSLLNRTDWNGLRVGTRVTFEIGIAHVPGKPRPAIRVQPITDAASR
jgi:ATP-dependent DNA helicase RecG